ncbi:TRAP transporter substrate-binding protein DctP [Chloroflexota bacterium]
MKRIIVVAVTILMLIGVLVAGCSQPATEPGPSGPGPAPAEGKTINLKFATFIPPFDVYAEQMKAWADELEAATDGRIKVTFYHAESLVKLPEIYDAVAAGTADIGMIDANITPERLAISGCITLPMVFKRASQTQQTMWALLQKYQEFNDEYDPVQVIWCHCPATSDAYGNKPMQTMDDLKGVKIACVTPYEVMSWKALGATPVSMGPTEMFTALERGVVDAASGDFNQAFIWKHFEITKYRTDNIDITARVSPIIMNKKTIASIPSDLRPIFDKVTDGARWSKESGLAFEGFFNNVSIKTIKEFDEKAGNPPFYVLPDDERQKWLETVLPVRDAWANEMEQKGLPGKAVLEDMLKFAEQYK